MIISARINNPLLHFEPLAIYTQLFLMGVDESESKFIVCMKKSIYIPEICIPLYVAIVK